jgi:hypothetical protein
LGGSECANLLQKSRQVTQTNTEPSSLSDCGNRNQNLAAPSQILPIFYVNIEHIDSKIGEIWIAQADFEPI